MANMSKGLVEARKQSIVDFLRDTGPSTYREIGEATGMSYWTTRTDIEQLVKDELVVATNKTGKEIYFGINGDRAIPSLNGMSGKPVSISDLIPRLGTIMELPTEIQFAKVMAIVYGQVLLALADNTVSHNDLEFARQQILEALKGIDHRQRLFMVILDRLLSNDPEVYATWGRDPRFDPEIALQAITKFYPDNANTYSRALQWIKKGRPVDAD